MNRATIENIATDAFKDYISNLTDGELLDMLSGNSGAYSGMPNLFPYADQETIRGGKP